MAGVLIDSSIISKLIQNYMPDLYKKFLDTDCEIILNSFIYKWLANLFLKTLDNKVNRSII